MISQFLALAMFGGAAWLLTSLFDDDDGTEGGDTTGDDDNPADVDDPADDDGTPISPTPPVPDQPEEPDPLPIDSFGAGRDLLVSPSALRAGGHNPYSGGAPFDVIAELDADTVEVATRGVDMGDGDDVAVLDGLNDDDMGRIGTVELGAGNDVFINRMAPGFGSAHPDVYGGEGDDLIHSNGDRNIIDGGAGDDTLISENTYVGHFFGGEGNDTITVSVQSTDASYVDGGAGNDTIDVRNASNISALGGDGNDIIYTGQNNSPGAGYVVSPDGGAGEDLLVHDASLHLGADRITDGIEMRGGADADRFELIFDEGGVLVVDPSSVEVLSGRFATLADFVPGEDFASIQPHVTRPGFEIGETRLEENAETGQTTLTVRFDHPEEAAHEMQVVFNTLGVTASDYEIVMPA